MTNTARHTKIVLALLAFTLLYFAIAAFGTKIGLWSWQFGLITMTLGGGMFVLGATAIAALVSLVIAARATPRRNGALAIAIVGLLVPGAALIMFLTAGSRADQNPVHDVATDTADPPMFSAETMTAREEAEANALSDYQTPLGELALYEGAAPELAIKSHAQIITDRYADLAPLPLAGASRADAVAAVAAAMGNMGFEDIRTDVTTGMVEGTSTSFWFGFTDDVVARISENEIDFRSASRVGRSDMGVNADRIAELRELVAGQIGQR
ncbi:DUF1499 domain-containing protein [Erythrobacter sp. R86502]|uniref:DUF1499 domain-containing protein n=1 Tax=Erythrobacter sp. R86502 TaxID=3093846 RepID=UPI0036D339FA